MWYAVYRADGSLHGTGSVKPIQADLDKQSLKYKEFNYNIQSRAKQWNASLLNFDDIALPRKRITVSEFKSLMLLPERAAIIQASQTDFIAAAFMDHLNTTQSVGLDDKDTIDGLSYLVSIKAITPERKTEILS